MKTTLLALLVALSPTMASAENDYKRLNEKIESLEKALRLQTLTTEAIRKDNYDLACKAQKEATSATHQAKIKDVVAQSDMQFAEICVVSRYTSQPNIPSWLTPVAGFEPAGVFFEVK